MQKWITKEILKYLSVEDDILVSMVINSLEEAVFLILIYFQQNGNAFDPKDLQLQVTGFLGKKSARFMEDLWLMLLSAQEDPDGIPAQLLEEKKKELLAQESKKKEKESKIKKQINKQIEKNDKDDKKDRDDRKDNKNKYKRHRSRSRSLSHSKSHSRSRSHSQYFNNI